jgi:hypothetical protein
MLHTTEVEFDAEGQVRPPEPLVPLPAGRALLTLLEGSPGEPPRRRRRRWRKTG